MNKHATFNKDTYGTFWRYVTKNKQKRRLGIFVHGFTLVWGITGAVEGAPFLVSICPLVIAGVYWLMSHRNYTGKTV